MTGASIVELLDYIDPTALPPDVKQTIKTIGPALIRGDHLSQIAANAGFRKDWARMRVADVRHAFLSQAAGHLDSMPPRLRERVLAELRELPPPRTSELGPLPARAAA